MIAETDTGQPTTEQSPTPSGATPDRGKCLLSDDGERLCHWPAAGAWKGQPLCERHLQKRRQQMPEHLARLARLDAALSAPLPDLDDAVDLLKRSAADWGLGLPADWQPLPDPEHDTPDSRVFCGACLALRWLRFDEPGPHNGFQSDVRRCPACLSSDRPERQNRIAAMAGLLQAQRAKTFATFRHVKGVEHAVAAAAGWAGRPDGWLVVWGTEGSGKTHLALAAANTLVIREQGFIWWHVGDLAREAKELMDRNLHFALQADLKRAEILFLDDLGAARPTDWFLSDFIEPLMNARYEARAATFITCIDPAKLRVEFSSSIVRRMEDPGVCRMVKNDAPQWGR